jgi:hypothetical protein
MPRHALRRRYLKLSIICLAALIAAYVFTGRKASAFSSGPPASHTNAPGEDNCTVCHSSFALNSGPGNLHVTGLPVNYLPNQLVPVTVTVNQVDAVVYGFQLTALDREGRQAGTLIVTDSQHTQSLSNTVGGHQRDYIEHTSVGTIPDEFDTRSWTFSWKTPPTRVGRVTLYAAGNAANSDGTSGGDYIYTTSASSYTGTATPTFDGDGKTDISIFHPVDGYWRILKSTDGAAQAQQWGLSEDKPVPGDYDGDGKTDIAVWRPSTGTWYILQSSNSSFRANQWGLSGDKPAPADFDGDGKTDLVVYRPSNGTWYILQSTNSTLRADQWGVSEDKPVPADYDGDGKADLAVFRPSQGTWYIYQSTNNSFRGQQWGLSTDKPVAGDYDGDGKTDPAVWRPSEGYWYALKSTDGAMYALQWGASGDVPVRGDYDGDGKTDPAVWRPSTGTWYILRSSDGAVVQQNLGVNGDVPVPSASEQN